MFWQLKRITFAQEKRFRHSKATAQFVMQNLPHQTALTSMGATPLRDRLVNAFREE